MPDGRTEALRTAAPPDVDVPQRYFELDGDPAFDLPMCGHAGALPSSDKEERNSKASVDDG
jgi:hypothetical protein